MQAITPNNRENLSTKSDVTGQSEYLLSHNGALDVNMSFPALVTVPFDTITVAYPDTSTEVYTYKSSGTTVATVTVVYSDAVTKQILSSVTRS